MSRCFHRQLSSLKSPIKITLKIFGTLIILGSIGIYLLGAFSPSNDTAGTLAGFAGAVIFVPIPEAFLGSLVAMIAEVVKIDFNEKSLDDNLVVPLVAGTVMLLVRSYL